MPLLSKKDIIKYLKNFDLISDRVCVQCPMNSEYFIPFLRKHNIGENVIKYYCSVTCSERFNLLVFDKTLLVENGCIERKEELKKIMKRYNKIIKNE